MNPSMMNVANLSIESDDDIFTRASSMGFGDIHFKHDSATNMRAIIAIHNTRRGPALGGCRCVPYPSTQRALFDVMNLARAMSYKAAMAGLPLGGGKAVIMRPDHIDDREALFESYGSFVDELGGRYISSVDSGTSVADMDIAARRTKHVCSTSNQGDPSPSTALGVRRGIEAAVKHQLGRDTIDGIHIAVQGAGHVGYYLAKELHALGAKLSMCDVNIDAVERCADEFNATIVDPEEVYSVAADVFAPCALGGIINDQTIDKLNAKIIAGATNNALANITLANKLHEEGILYAPDYVINAGGLMQVSITDETALREKIYDIYATLTKLFQRSSKDQASPAIVVDQMAEEILYGPEHN